jgi:hypothetical protein
MAKSSMAKLKLKFTAKIDGRDSAGRRAGILWDASPRPHSRDDQRIPFPFVVNAMRRPPHDAGQQRVVPRRRS